MTSSSPDPSGAPTSPHQVFEQLMKETAVCQDQSEVITRPVRDDQARKRRRVVTAAENTEAQGEWADDEILALCKVVEGSTEGLVVYSYVTFTYVS